MNDKKQRASLPEHDTSNGKWRDTPVCATATVVAYQNGEFHEPVTVRWFQSPRADGMSRLYCTIWTYGTHASGSAYYSGHGYASGCGYHKPSAALAEACESAGIKLSKYISGCGDSVMDEALLAIAHALGFRRCHVVRV